MLNISYTLPVVANLSQHEQNAINIVYNSLLTKTVLKLQKKGASKSYKSFIQNKNIDTMKVDIVSDSGLGNYDSILAIEHIIWNLHKKRCTFFVCGYSMPSIFTDRSTNRLIVGEIEIGIEHKNGFYQIIKIPYTVKKKGILYEINRKQEVNIDLDNIKYYANEPEASKFIWTETQPTFFIGDWSQIWNTKK